MIGRDGWDFMVTVMKFIDLGKKKGHIKPANSCSVFRSSCMKYMISFGCHTKPSRIQYLVYVPTIRCHWLVYT